MNPHESNIYCSFFKKYTIKDVIYLLYDVWSKTSQNTLKNAWRNLKINLDFEPISEPSVILPYQTILSSNEIQYFITSDDNDPGWRILNDQEIVELSILKFNKMILSQNQKISQSHHASS